MLPSSPGVKVKQEQNPSEELISSVEPSFDLLEISECMCRVSRDGYIPREIGKCSVMKIADH